MQQCYMVGVQIHFLYWAAICNFIAYLRVSCSFIGQALPNLLAVITGDRPISKVALARNPGPCDYRLFYVSHFIDMSP